MYRFGNAVTMDLYGKSHGPCVGCILGGIPEGLKVDMDKVLAEMDLRKPKGRIGTPRRESDVPEFLSGIEDGTTTGGPICIEIKNGNTDGSKYMAFYDTPRPGHADLPALLKFPDHDLRGSGQFSGRLTAAVVAAGAVAKQFVSGYGMSVAAFTRSVADSEERDLQSALESRNYQTRACTEELDRRITERIEEAGSQQDSVGGVVECIVEGLPIGFGGIWFDALDAELAAAMFGIPACKGVEFGDGFNLAKMRGSESNDCYHFEDSRIVTTTNHLGGIVGGMSDGAPVVFRTVFKPTPSIARPQHTVNLRTLEDDTVRAEGRHDPCIVPRAVAVVEAMTALTLADQIRRGFR